jgi:hypothetical protein
LGLVCSAAASALVVGAGKHCWSSSKSGRRENDDDGGGDSGGGDVWLVEESRLNWSLRGFDAQKMFY